jgi:protein involved in sex pheromone biosynthesis
LFDFSLIQKFGWYSPGNRIPKNNNGISRDHKISINEAIKNEYDPFYISHSLNCQLMEHSENKTKYTKSSLIYTELVSLVDKYLEESIGTDPNPQNVNEQLSRLP